MKLTRLTHDISGSDPLIPICKIAVATTAAAVSDEIFCGWRWADINHTIYTVYYKYTHISREKKTRQTGFI